MPDKGALASRAAYLAVALCCLSALVAIEPVTVLGGSMRPLFAPGDLALVRRHARVGVGDVALIRAPGHSAVLHRVVGVDAMGRFSTRGDANPIPDFESCSAADITGKVVGVVPLGGLIVRWRGVGQSATLPAQSDSTR